jgi:D-alanyl-D-alanine carboxypeptidase
VAISGTWYLSGLWPPFSEAVEYLLAYAQSYQLEGTIVSGYRSLQEQTLLYSQGRTLDQITNQVALRGAGNSVTDAPAGQSAHNFGLAIDVEGPDRDRIVSLAGALGFGTVSWDPEHIEWPNWRMLLR